MGLASMMIMIVAAILEIGGLFAEGYEISVIGMIVLVIGWVTFAYEEKHKPMNCVEKEKGDKNE